MQRRSIRRMTIAAVFFSLGVWMTSVPAQAAEVGDKAPNFMMHSTVGETVSLAEYQGQKNVLLFFFLATFTGV